MKKPRRINESDDRYREHMLKKLIMIIRLFVIFSIIGEIVLIISLIINGFGEFSVGKLLICIFPALVFICSVLILRKLKNIDK